jgi:hypothetical protein
MFHDSVSLLFNKFELFKNSLCELSSSDRFCFTYFIISQYLLCTLHRVYELCRLGQLVQINPCWQLCWIRYTRLESGRVGVVDVEFESWVIELESWVIELESWMIEFELWMIELESTVHRV